MAEPTEPDLVTMEEVDAARALRRVIPGWVEKRITIEGRELTGGQAMALRVAVSNFYMQLTEPGHPGKDDPLFIGYRERLVELLRMLSR